MRHSVAHVCVFAGKRQLLPNLPEARRRFYSGVIYRFCVFIVVTLLCAALTVAFYVVSQLDEDSWKWEERRPIEYHSAFITGVFDKSAVWRSNELVGGKLGKETSQVWKPV